ncbi:MAG: cell wall-binding repeat-containing protein [Tissierellia bacterium]|nr:cell wall-binding repeat-containing protein [Tissierellia bacterium]
MNKKIIKKIAAVSLAFMMTLSIGQTKSLAAKKINISRVSGNNRYDTSAQISRLISSKSQFVVLVSGENEADGLAGGVLASLLKAPVLLTSKDTLPSVIENRIKSLEAKYIYILGGENSISKNVEERINSFGNVKTQRISGTNRFDTAAKIAGITKDMDGISDNRYFAIANGFNWPDSLSASGYLANFKIPLLLTDSKSLSKESAAFIENNFVNRVIIIGGKGSVPEHILPKLTPARLSGKDRYDTSLSIAKDGFKNPVTVIITSGERYEDALSAAPLANYIQGPILLASKGKVSDDILKYIIKDTDINRVIIVGGRTLLPDYIFKEIAPGRIPQEIGHPDEKPVG